MVSKPLILENLPFRLADVLFKFGFEEYKCFGCCTEVFIEV